MINRNTLAYIQLMRPANLISAVADILAGFAIGGGIIRLTFSPTIIEISRPHHLLALTLSSIGLYAGGVILNDVFDAEIDKVERPERAIPSGRASIVGASILAISMFLIAYTLAFYVSPLSGIIAISISIMAVLYDKIGKHTAWGPINMGACRGLNLLLAMFCDYSNWYLMILPIVYIASITLISKGEVHGLNKTNYYWAFLGYSIVMVTLFMIGNSRKIAYWEFIPFLLFWAYMVISKLFKAYQTNLSKDIMIAVKTGVISLIILNASIGAIYGGFYWGSAIIILLPISLFLAKKFAVT
ncbi:MAG: polyprenyltransferase [Cytophagales bacterium]|nr:MAG: polyprenyltransferase [Cytophagales bacterium]